MNLLSRVVRRLRHRHRSPLPVGIVRQIDHVNLTAVSIDRSAAFYRDLFGFERVEVGDGPPPWAILRAGDALICLIELPDLKPRPGGFHGVCHFGLRVATDRRALEDRLARLRIQVDRSQRYPHSHSIYVRDPADHIIEIALWDADEIRF